MNAYSCLAHTETLEDESSLSILLLGFWRGLYVFFTMYGVNRIDRLIADNGS